MSSASNIDELLSGLLDGKLSEDERRQLDELLQADSSVAMQLEQLRQIRADLQRVPTRRLKSDFAARVIEQARREAAEAELPADHHVLRELKPRDVAAVDAAAQVQTSNQSAIWNLSRRSALSLAALAASILLVAFLANKYSGKSDLIPLANIPELQNNRTENGELGTIEQNNLPFNDLATKIAAETPSTNDAEAAMLPRTENTASGLPVRDTQQFVFDVLLICDVKITQKAWDDNVLGAIFEKAGIQMANPVFASADITDSLAETRAIVQNPKANNEPQDEVALIFVCASAKAVDKTMIEIWRQANHFPSAALDIAFDRPDQELLKKLYKAIDGVEDVPSATPILLTSTVSKTLDDVAQFSTATRVKFVSSEERSELASSGSDLVSPEEDVTSYALLVIRKPAQQ